MDTMFHTREDFLFQSSVLLFPNMFTVERQTYSAIFKEHLENFFI